MAEPKMTTNGIPNEPSPRTVTLHAFSTDATPPASARSTRLGAEHTSITAASRWAR